MVNSTRETNSHLHCRVQRDNAQMKCLAKKHNNMNWPELDPGPCDSEYCVLDTPEESKEKPTSDRSKFSPECKGGEHNLQCNLSMHRGFPPA